MDQTADPGELSATEHSSSLAQLSEFRLLADPLQEAWFDRRMVVDVMHSSVDAFGNDLVLESGNVLRHVQQKTRASKGRTSSYAINLKLADRPSGCVVWVGYERRPSEHALDLEYRFLGARPGEPLPPLGDAEVRHAQANAQGKKLERPGLRLVKLSSFERVDGISDLLDRLFGAG